jgi:hypothetical protein
LTRSELVAHAAVPAAAADDEVTAGLLPPLGEVPPDAAVVTCELAAGEPDVAGELLGEDEHPATMARPAQAATARARRPGRERLGAGERDTARSDT